MNPGYGERSIYLPMIGAVSQDPYPPALALIPIDAPGARVAPWWKYIPGDGFGRDNGKTHYFYDRRLFYGPKLKGFYGPLLLSNLFSSLQSSTVLNVIDP